MSVIGGLVIGKLVSTAVDVALGRIAKSRYNPVTDKDVPALKEILVKEVTERVEPVVQNANNQEPLYKSRVMLGAVSAAIVAIGNIGVMYTDGVANTPNDYLTQVAVIVPVFYAIYGRIVNKKPLWTK